MEWLFALLIGGFLFFTCVIMPWANRRRVHDLEVQMGALRKQLRDLLSFLEKTGMSLPPELVVPPKIWEWQLQQPTPSKAVEAPKAAVTESVTPARAATQEPVRPTPPPVEKEQVSFEQQFGARLPVWIGGIALALAGFFLVKYSIETGLLSPTVRVVLGGLFGIGMLFVADKIRTNPDFANGTRIAQALSGAGIADLYVCLFAATSLYDLLPAFIGLAGMAVVTGTAMILALRHGMPIAILGLVGGLLTPALVSSDHPSAALLFIYLYAVISGLMVVIRQKAWWGMVVPALLGGFAWVGIWLVGSGASPFDAVCMGLFLLALSGTYVFLSPRDDTQMAGDNEIFTLPKMLNYLSLGGAAVMMAFVVGQSGYTTMAWGLFGLLTLGTIGLAYADQERYGFAPWLAIGINLLMLVGWIPPDLTTYASVLVSFAVIFVASGYLLQSRSARPLLWAGLTAAASLSYYLLGYSTLRGAPLLSDIHLFWGGLALCLALLGTYSVSHILTEVPDDHAQKQHLLAIYAATGTAFISLALTIELPREFLSVAFALELLAIVWISTKIEVKALRHIAAALGCVFGILLIPQILLLMQLTAYSLVEAKLALQESVPIVNWPLFQLGLPALCFIVASYWLRERDDDRLVRALEGAAIALIAVMGYYLTRHAFHVDENILFITAGFIERGVITNILFLYGLACLWVGRHYLRDTVALSGLVLSGVAMFRIVYFDLIAYNPLWSAQAVGSLPILNALLLTYGAPLLWMALLSRNIRALDYPQFCKPIASLMLVVAFTLVSLEVRQLFHGSLLNGSSATNAETYSYSAAWLMFGLALLFYGTLRMDKMVRVASLAIMILTVGKVFLYDAAELEGLYRVFSFAGLGLSLLGLSWFYTRFVFSVADVMGAKK